MTNGPVQETSAQFRQFLAGARGFHGRATARGGLAGLLGGLLTLVILIALVIIVIIIAVPVLILAVLAVGAGVLYRKVKLAFAGLRAPNGALDGRKNVRVIQRDARAVRTPPADEQI